MITPSIGIAQPRRVLVEAQRSGDAVVLHAAALQQRMAERRFEIRLPGAGEQLARA